MDNTLARAGRPLVALAGGWMLLAAAAAPSRAAHPSDILYVARFEAAGVSGDEARTVEQAVCNAVSQDKRFVVRCRDQTRADFRNLPADDATEAGQFAADCGPHGCLGASAKAVQAKWVLTGVLARAGAQYLLSLVVLDPVSGQAIARVEERVPADLAKVVDRLPDATRTLLTPPASPKQK